MYDTVLVPTDGSEHAERGARHGFALADAFDASVHVLSVADVERQAGPFDAGGATEEFIEKVETESEEAVEDTVALAGDDQPVETAVVEGQIEEVILDYADEHGVDLIAMGTRGRSGISRLAAGSVAEHVVRHSTHPVLTARATDTEPVTDYDDVMVPTDGSEAARAAVDHGIAVARAFDATIHAVNIVDLGAVTAEPESIPGADLVETLEAGGKDATEGVASRIREAGLDAVARVREGYPGTDLVDYVEDEGIDIVVMGTHGRTGIDRLLLGSTTEHTIRNADVPVVSVHPEIAEETD